MNKPVSMTHGVEASARRRPTPVARDAQTFEEIAANFAVVATFAAILSLFALSPITLEAIGFSYLTPGGGVLTKLHPASFVAPLAIGLRCLSTPHPARTAWRLFTDDAGVVLLLGATIVAGVIAVGVAKTPLTPLIDTFILPVLVVILLRDLDPKLVRMLAILVGILLCANAVVALAEFLSGWRLVKIDIPDGVSADPTRSDAVFSWQAQFAREWRATAILGHPLVNGLIIGAFILCLAARGSRWIPAVISAPVMGLELVSMFAFGARASLVLSIAFSVLLFAHRSVVALGQGTRVNPRFVAVGLVGAGCLAIGADVMFQYNFFDRMIERFGQDQGSAETRVIMFDLLHAVPWTELVFVPDQDRVATLQRIFGLEFGIESSWIGLALNYGLIVTAMLVIGLVALSRSVVRACGGGATIILVFYFILVSAAATLSTKTTTLAMLLCLIFLFLPGDVRRRRTRPDKRSASEPNPWR